MFLLLILAFILAFIFVCIIILPWSVHKAMNATENLPYGKGSYSRFLSEWDRHKDDTRLEIKKNYAAIFDTNMRGYNPDTLYINADIICFDGKCMQLNWFDYNRFRKWRRKNLKDGNEVVDLVILKEHAVYATIRECEQNKFQLIVYPCSYPNCWLAERFFSSKEEALKFTDKNKQFYIREWNRIYKNVLCQIYYSCKEADKWLD